MWLHQRLLILSTQNLLPIPAEIIRGVFLCGYITDARIIKIQNLLPIPAEIIRGIFLCGYITDARIIKIQNLLPIPAEIIRGIFLCGYINDCSCYQPRIFFLFLLRLSGVYFYVVTSLMLVSSKSRIFFLFLLRLSGVYFYVATSTTAHNIKIQNLLPIPAEVIRGIFLCGYINDCSYHQNPEYSSYSC